MHVLFVHPNFPAQFRCVAPRLASDYGWRCTFATRNAITAAPVGVEKVVYRVRWDASVETHPVARSFQAATGHCLGAYEALKARTDVRPDLVVAHSGFGSSLFLPHLYDAPVVNFFEYFFRPAGQELGYRPELPVTETTLLRWRTNNAMVLHDLEACDRGWSPSFYQRDLMPEEYRGKIEVLPEGIDTELYRRRGDCGLRISDCGLGNQRVLPDGTVVPDGTRIVTYVARGFESVRGFDVFMRAARRIYQQFPDVLFVCVGSDRVYYGNDVERLGGRPLRRHVLDGGDYDLSRFHFTGFVPEQTLAQILALSDLHVYLTSPFITSWSMLDAMSCSCVLLASDQPCTREYVRDGRNGLLCDFFDVEGIAKRAVDVLKDPRPYRRLGRAARRTIEQRYSLDVCLPRIKNLFEDVVAKGRQRASVRAELLVRRGTAPPRPAPPVLAALAAGENVETRTAYEGAIPFGADGREAQKGPSPLPSPPSTGERVKERTVLFCWELGGGLGHLMQVLPLARGLADAGHAVFVAMRDVAAATAVFGGAGVRFLQAPSFVPRRPRFPRQQNFAHLMGNVGFGDDFELFGVACAWRNLMDMVKPDLVVFDHSPVALLAARSLDQPARRALIGSGFCCPPDRCPMPRFRPEGSGRADEDRLAAIERELLERVNRLLGHWGQPPLDRLGQLYSDVDENFLTTFPELDHYPGRERAAYWGPVVAGDDAGGEEPLWPDAPGKRIYAYLKPFPELPRVVEALAGCRQPTIVCIDGASEALRRKLQCATVRVEAAPLDLRRAARECDLAVLNGGHGVTAEMLLAGKPTFHVPLVLEQRLTGEAVKALGAGEVAPPGSADPVGVRLDALLSDDHYSRAARRFAERYAAFDPAKQRTGMLTRAEELLTSNTPATPALAALAL